MLLKAPKSLVRYLREGRCVLFAGSGLSAWGKLPTWSGILKIVLGRLREEQIDPARVQELEDLVAVGKLLEVAEYCKESLGKHLYSEIMSEHLRGGGVETPEPHSLIVNLPFSAIVTTNYDKLLESAYLSSGFGLPRVATHSDTDVLGPLLFNGHFFILKAHGDIDRPETLVVTTSDYREIIHSNPAFNSFFSALLLTKAILFVGYSLSDPDFRLLLDRQLSTFKGHVPERYALMNNIGDIECEVLRKSAGIRVLKYQQHPEILEFLTGLRREIVTPSWDDGVE